MHSHRSTWAIFCFAIGTITLLIGMNGMPIGLLILAGAATAAGLNNILKQELNARRDKTIEDAGHEAQADKREI